MNNSISLASRFYALILSSTCLATATPIIWTTPEQKLEVAPASEEITFSFEFTNESKNPIVLADAQASCGCTLPKIDTKIYPPGEKGTITGTYRPGHRRGLSSVNITVKGNELEGDIRRPFSDNLKLSVFVPELVGITPGIVLWPKNSELEEKKVRLEVKQSASLMIKLVKLNNDAFTATLVEIFPGRAYDLVVTPKATTEPIQTMATLEASTPEGKPIKLFAHFMVR